MSTREQALSEAVAIAQTGEPHSVTVARAEAFHGFLNPEPVRKIPEPCSGFPWPTAFPAPGTPEFKAVAVSVHSFIRQAERNRGAYIV